MTNEVLFYMLVLCIFVVLFTIAGVLYAVLEKVKHPEESFAQIFERI